jgi:hypothetical protein
MHPYYTLLGMHAAVAHPSNCGPPNCWKVAWTSSKPWMQCCGPKCQRACQQIHTAATGLSLLGLSPPKAGSSTGTPCAWQQSSMLLGSSALHYNQLDAVHVLHAHKASQLHPVNQIVLLGNYPGAACDWHCSARCPVAKPTFPD